MASAAYRAGEKLYNVETGIIHDFTRKGGVVMSEIMLPDNAPERFSDRQVLWNEVQQIEKRSDAQFAREVEVAFPVEMNRDEQIECVRAFIKDNFVSQGMIADWALHDKGDGNPHAHIMLTMRGFDDHENWMQKQKSVFANSRDEKGRPIYDPSLPMYDPKDREGTSQYRIPKLDENGNQKTRIRKGKGTEYLWEKITIPANDWNDRSKAEEWRASWADHCNCYLDKDHQIDHRSYERQGLDQEPTIHEGITARQIERDDNVADRCQINRDIRERNTIRKQMKEVAKEITELITEKARSIVGRFKEFRRGRGDAQRPRGNAGHSGESAGRNRGAVKGKPEIDRATGRIAELKRAVDRTDREIKITDQRITELRAIADGKEAMRNERLERLKRRRDLLNSGRNTGSTGTAPKRVRSAESRRLENTRGDIEAFLRKLDTSEQASAEKRDDRIAERKDRDASRKRQSVRRELELAEEKRQAARSDPEITERVRSRGRSR